MAELHNWLLSDSQYIVNMVNFIDIIICCSMVDILLFKNMHQKAPSASLNKSDKEFALKLYKDSNSVTFKMQIHSFLHNITYFKYGVAIIQKCWFDFPCPHIDKTKIIELGSIDVSRNHPWINL